MKDIGIVICNYNKEEYILKCIESVLTSTISNFDVIVVDNASTDQSVIKIKELFGDQIKLIVNENNLGGSGGFNSGIREALSGNYRYIMLMDNDIVADKYAVDELYRFMEVNKEVGMVGSKVYFMDYPDTIWGYGGHIDFEKYIQIDHHKNEMDNESIPEVEYCDYVAACSLMVRTDAISKTGLMPEENFIYWDDLEWGYRFKEAGYQVAVCGRSKIWHKAGGRNAGNTFIHYYMWRNRIRFFLKVLPLEKREDFAKTILKELFRMIYSCHLKGEDNIVKTVMYALNDAANGISGHAEDYKILPREKCIDRLQLALTGVKSVIILYNGDLEGLGNIVRNIKRISKEISVVISIQNIKEVYNILEKQFHDIDIAEQYLPENFDLHLVMCKHIFEINATMPIDIYIDSWCNVLLNEEDFNNAILYKKFLEFFVLANENLLI